MSNKGNRKYQCADCQATQMEHWTAMARRCKPRCKACGSTFLVPYSDGALEQDTNAGTARAIKDASLTHLGTSAESLMMRGERDVPRSEKHK